MSPARWMDLMRVISSYYIGGLFFGRRVGTMVSRRGCDARKGTGLSLSSDNIIASALASWGRSKGGAQNAVVRDHV